jgi:hypothetical protein
MTVNVCRDINDSHMTHIIPEIIRFFSFLHRPWAKSRPTVPDTESRSELESASDTQACQATGMRSGNDYKTTTGTKLVVR